MSQLEKRRTSTFKESKSKKVQKLEENFAGFDANDDLTISIEIKTKRLKNIEKELNEKKKSQSNQISSSEKDNGKSNQNIKKLKKDNSQTILENSLDISDQYSLELTTPTFNLTTISKNRRSVNRTPKDIAIPLYRLPFDHGWKRELVYRTTNDSSLNKGTQRPGDVYYYTPTLRKLRSLREVQEQLNLIPNTPVTIENFTFMKHPVGMDDDSKELIRDANYKLYKDGRGFWLNEDESKNSKRMTNVESSDDNELNTSNQRKAVTKTQKKSKPKSKKDKIQLESTPAIMPDELQACESSIIPTVSSPKLDKTSNTEVNSTDVKQGLSTSDGEVIMQAPCGMRCPNSDEPATLMCAQCLVYYHPACVNLNVNLKIVGYVCINCRSSVRHRSRRVQSSHTVVVGVSEPEELRVEPIRIRQQHQISDSPNFFIDKTSVSKTEEQNNEIDECIDENDAAMNTVTCQGIPYESAMLDNVFHEQYVFEMKQTRGPSLMTCVVQEPKNLDVSSEMNGPPPERNVCMQSFNDMVVGMRHVFAYLNIKELVIASRVCTSWNMISKEKCLWRYVHLKNVMVYNWDKLIKIVIRQDSITLDTRRMLIPYKARDFEIFWGNFSFAIKKASQLHELELYRCPVNVVHECMLALPQLSVFNATSIKYPNALKDAQAVNEFKTVKLSCISKMVNLKQLRLKGLLGFKLEISPTLTFESMTKLRTLSITSVKSFPKNICLYLETITPNLEHLEIGDCECIPDDFPMLIKRFTNLKILRLENCCGRWEQFARETFLAIRSLKNLKVLELINIEFSNCVEEELEKLTNLESLLIIPAYVSQSATTNRHLFDCFKSLSKTLKYVVWGLTHELLRVTDLFITQYQQNQHTLGYSIDISQTNDASNNIPILRTRTTKPQTEDLAVAQDDDDDGEDTSDNVDILSVSALQNLLDETMVNAKTKVIKVAYSATTRIYIQEQFPEIRFI